MCPAQIWQGRITYGVLLPQCYVHVALPKWLRAICSHVCMIVAVYLCERVHCKILHKRSHISPNAALLLFSTCECMRTPRHLMYAPPSFGGNDAITGTQILPQNDCSGIRTVTLNTFATAIACNSLYHPPSRPGTKCSKWKGQLARRAGRPAAA